MEQEPRIVPTPERIAKGDISIKKGKVVARDENLVSSYYERGWFGNKDSEEAIAKLEAGLRLSYDFELAGIEKKSTWIGDKLMASSVNGNGAEALTNRQLDARKRFHDVYDQFCQSQQEILWEVCCMNNRLVSLGYPKVVNKYLLNLVMEQLAKIYSLR